MPTINVVTALDAVLAALLAVLVVLCWLWSDLRLLRRQIKEVRERMGIDTP